MTKTIAGNRPRLALCATALAALVAGCGGGGGDEGSADTASASGRARILAAAQNPAGWVAVTQPNDVLLQNLTIPADAPTRGMWSGVGNWPMLGLHQAVLPDGRVLTWGTTPDGNAQNGRYFDVWDPNRGLFDAGAHNLSYDPNRQDSFCAPAVWLGDGRLMITGGNSDAGTANQTYNPATNTFARAANVADGRWYSAMVTMADGRVMMLGGINPYTEGQYNDVAGALARGESSLTPEIFENGAWRTLFNAQSRTAFGPDFLRASLPKVWLAPDGRVFGIGTDQMYYVDANAAGGGGAITIVGPYKTPPRPVLTDAAPNVGPTMTGVMYAPGKVMTVGGNAYHNGAGFWGSRMATSIDINGGGAVLTELPPMANGRVFANTIVLPDGKVLVTGGETRANNDPAFGVFAAELWNPATNTWSTLASARVFRGYHSQTSLLTNGTVLSTGGGNPGPIQLTGEVFYPPYLFRTVNGVAQLAPRPQLVGISGLKHAHGAQMQFDLSSNGAIAQVALIGLSSGTHSFNAGQRRIPLTYTQDNFRITATMPAANLAPPGYYQLIAVDASGVPSRGTIIAVGATVSAPAVTTTPYTPPDTGTVTPPPPPPVSTPPATATACAAEGAICALPAGSTATVYFGVGTTWFSRTGVTGSIGCNVATFGDPAFGALKSCVFSVTSAPAAPGAGTGLSATYFATRDFTGAAALTRTEAPQFDWGTGAPAAGVPADNFSVRWTGSVQAVEAGNYQFRTLSDDGVRVWVNGVQVINNWTEHPPTEDTSAIVALAAGQRVSIVVEYFEAFGGATLRLNWLRPGGTWGAIPAAQLYPTAGTPPPAPVTAPTFTAPLITAGGTATYTVAATAGVTYSWDFGDGSPATAFSTTASTTKLYANPGIYGVTLTARGSDGSLATRSVLQAVGVAAAAQRPTASSATALETRAGASARLWVANPDNNSVAVIDTATNARVAEIAVGTSPRSVAVAPDGRVWVTNKDSASISIVSPTTLAVVATVTLPRASQPHGLVFANAGSAFVALEATGQLLKLDPATGAVQGTLPVGSYPRHLSATPSGGLVLVSRFITNPLPGEGTATLDTTTAGAEVLAVNAGPMTLNRTIVLRHSDKVDNENQGAGIPNYLAAAVISPDGVRAWVPSKQDNIRRGTRRNGQALDFQNSVRAISSRIDMATLAEDSTARIDHDNSSLGSAAAYHPSGAYLFVALETSRQVAIVDPVRGRELLKVDVGRAPQAVSVSADGTRLYVQNFMDRSVSVLDLGPLLTQGQLIAPLLATVGTVAIERLPAQVLQGKQLFYDARDPRLARDSYMSCASCHNDAGHDGRTWDFTSFGEGLRNTPSLKGRAGIGQGFQHWSANFDEIQDFEGQIRNFAGGTGLMTTAQFNTGTRNTPLGDRKAGVSADLDALAAYLASLNTFDRSPNRNPDGSLTAAAAAGRTVFANANCASCHGGTGFTVSGDGSTLRNIGTIRPTSGQRLGTTLAGIDVPTLRDAWKTAPYLHDGSAPTLAAAVQAHQGNTVAGADLANLVAYLQQIGSEEAAPGVAPPPPPPSSNQPPASAVACAVEGGTCTIPAGSTATVYYGAGTTWAVRTGVTGSIGCNNGIFGDPAPGVAKSCRYQAGGTVPVNQPPTVSVAVPASVTVGTAASLTATAADADGTVARVEFYAGSTLLGTDSTAPYGLSWTPTAAGTFSVTARAVDNTGAATTSTAVTITATAPAGGLPAGALAEWTFDGATSTSAADSSGNGRTLSLGSGVTLQAAGRAGAAMQMAGPASFAGGTTAAPVVNTAGSFSVSGWIRFDQLPQCWNQILASQDGVTVSGFYLGIIPPCNGSQPRATFAMLGADLDASATFRVNDTGVVVTGTWYHLVAVRDATANTMALYVNGRLVGTVANPTKWAANGSFAVGRAKFSSGLRDPVYGAIDGVRAYGRALTAAEVTTLFQAAR